MNVESVLKLTERQAQERGLALCPVDGSIYAKLDRVTDTVFWIKAGHRVAREEIEQTLRLQSGFAPQVSHSNRRT